MKQLIIIRWNRIVSIWLQKRAMKTIFEDFASKNTAVDNKQE